MNLEIIAHRGDPVTRIENTLPAIEAAIEAGARIVEIDVQLSADGVPVLLHDQTTQRLWGDPRPVRAQTLAELRRHRADDATIPTLDEALAVASGRAQVMIDMVDVAFAGPAWRVSRGADVSWCGDVAALHAIRRADADAEIYLTWPSPDAPEPALVASLDPAYVNPPYPYVTEEFCAAVARPISAWTVDHLAEAERLIGLGVRRIISNRSAWLRQELTRAAVRASATTA